MRVNTLQGKKKVNNKMTLEFKARIDNGQSHDKVDAWAMFCTYEFSVHCLITCVTAVCKNFMQPLVVDEK